LDITELTLKRIGVLLDLRDADLAALDTAKMLVDILGIFTPKICFNLSPSPFDLDMVMRCVSRKAEETLLSIITLVEAKQSYYAMPLLRPLCEEYLLAQYLCTLDRSIADKIIKEKTILDILKGIQAQNKFFPEAARIFQFTEFERLPDQENQKLELQDRIATQQRKLRDLGVSIGWGRRDFPTARYMADATQNGHVYDFFYHASSGAVHASFHHLARMVWGESTFSVDNKNFSQYYGRFALTYGTWLTCLTMAMAISYFPDHWPKDLKDSFSILFAFCIKPAIIQKAPPIVTHYELRWNKASNVDTTAT